MLFIKEIPPDFLGKSLRAAGDVDDALLRLPSFAFAATAKLSPQERHLWPINRRRRRNKGRERRR